MEVVFSAEIAARSRRPPHRNIEQLTPQNTFCTNSKHASQGTTKRGYSAQGACPLAHQPDYLHDNNTNNRVLSSRRHLPRTAVGSAKIAVGSTGENHNRVPNPTAYITNLTPLCLMCVRGVPSLGHSLVRNEKLSCFSDPSHKWDLRYSKCFGTVYCQE